MRRVVATLDFYYLGKRVREPSGLSDTNSNRKRVRKQLDLIIAEIENDLFQFAKRFPNSNSTLEIRQFKQNFWITS